MDKTGYIFVAFAVLLALAPGTYFSAEARLVESGVSGGGPQDGRSSPLHSEGQYFENDDIANTSNISGNSVRQGFEVSGDGKSADLIVEGLDSNISLEPGFDVVNNMEQVVQLECINDYTWTPVVVVDTFVPVGERYGWALQTIDPNNIHVKYKCEWTWSGTNPSKRMYREVWADESHQNLMPFYCVRCIFKVADDGLYLFNLQSQVYVKLQSWP